MIKLNISKMIGRQKYTFQVEGSNFYEVVKESEKLSFPDVLTCGKCKKDNLTLATRYAQNKYKYTFIRCLNPDCKAQLIFGQTKEDSNVFYLRRNEKKELDWEIYEPEDDERQPS